MQESGKNGMGSVLALVMQASEKVRKIITGKLIAEIDEVELEAGVLRL